MEERLGATPLIGNEIIKHWLLNAAVECPTGLNRIFPPPNTLSLNMKAVPNPKAEDYSRNLLGLFDSGMIVLSSEFGEDDLTTRSGVSRVLERFLRLPKDYQRVRYLRPGDRTSVQIDRSPSLQANFKLSVLGGETWQRVAMPEWDRFIAAYTTSLPVGESGPWEGEIFSPNRDLIIAWMGWYPEVRGEKILVESIKWDGQKDFEVLYWKRLPFVHRATFQVKFAKERWTSYKVPEWFSEWWGNSLHWHNDPWELPSWPSEAEGRSHLRMKTKP